MDYETRKQQGKIPVVGVNTFRDSEAGGEPNESVHLARATEAEKQSQLKRLARFKKKNEKAAPAAIKRLQEAALSGENIFAQLLDTVRVCSLGQITQALFEVGGRYRRNM